jgi:ribonuclease HII
MFALERQYWEKGYRLVAGVDEAGRGPLAGPVVAAAVVLDRPLDLPEVNDSKLLSPSLRKRLFHEIRRRVFEYGVGIVGPEEIDRLNILQATLRAMQLAVEDLSTYPGAILVDGNQLPEGVRGCVGIVGGDRSSFSIAAASILAKVTRDTIMERYDRQFPLYGFVNHKGYATARHLDAIEKYGLCPIHRRSFHPKRFRGGDHST